MKRLEVSLTSVPPRIISKAGKARAPQRARELEQFLRDLRSESAEIRQNAQNYLRKYGRFYEPVLKSLLENERDAKVRRQIQELISLSE